MSKHVVLLRGVNLGRRNRIAMSELRVCLEEGGFEDVSTYVQSGNVLVSSRYAPGRVGREANTLIRNRFGIDVAVLVRSRDEISEVIRRNPLADVAIDPRRYIVTFLSTELPPGFADDLRSVAGRQPFSVIGREVYSWHPDGVGRSPLFEKLARKDLRIDGTSRNWATVTALLEMADASTSR